MHFKQHLLHAADAFASIGSTCDTIYKMSNVNLGQEVKLSPELLASARESIATIGASRPRGGWQLKTLHTVRGHIRHQAFGPKHTERKVIWIKPFTQGPRGGDVVAHVYKAQQKQKVQ